MIPREFDVGQRPNSLWQVVDLVNAGQCEFGEALAEFIDEAKKMGPAGLSKSLRVYPGFLSKSNPGFSNWHDAYIGATAEHLCRGANIPIPDWTERRERFLSRAWFDNHGLTSLNAMMVAESPLAFRRRLIFTEAKPLRRA